MEKENKNVFIQALNQWGAKAQMEMAQEEATELALAIRKQVRNNDKQSFNNMVDEIADVEIMIEQLKIIHEQSDLSNLVEERKIFKINRLSERLNKLNHE